MEKKYIFYRDEILKLFKNCNISSIYINGKLITDYNKMDNLTDNDKITINKKYLKLFDEPNFVLKHFVPDNENIYISRNGRYKKAKISFHSKCRFLTRFIILYNLYNESVTSFLLEQMKPIYEKLKQEIHYIKNIKETKHFITNFVSSNNNEIEKIILSLLNNSIILKEESLIYKKRSKTHGDHNLILSNNLLFIYSCQSELIVTTLIHSLNIQNLKSKDIIKKINKQADNYNLIFNILNKD